MTLHGFTITERGVTVGDMLHGVTGRLGWSALRMDAVPPPTNVSA